MFGKRFPQRCHNRREGNYHDGVDALKPCCRHFPRPYVAVALVFGEECEGGAGLFECAPEENHESGNNEYNADAQLIYLCEATVCQYEDG